MKKLFYSSGLFFLFFTFLILGLNLAPTVTFIKHSPSDRYFPLMHNNSQDYYFYLSLMREGAQGQWLTTIPFTTEVHTSSLVFSYFLILGKLSQLFGLSMELGYLIVRILGSILFFLSTWFLIKKLKIPYPRLTYLFFLFASPFLKGDSPYLYWWTGIDAIRRSSYLPHHMFGGFLLISTLILIINFIQSGKIKYFIFSLLLIVPILLIHTPSLLILIMILPAAAVGFWIRNLIKANDTSPEISEATDSLPALLRKAIQAETRFTKKTIFILLYSSLGAISMLIFAKLMEGDALWKHALEWEKTLQLSFLNEILGGFGILLPFALIGIVRSIISKNFSYWLISSWFLVPIIFLPLAPLFQISNTRLVQGVPFLPFAILAVVGIDGLIHWELIENLKFKIRNVPKWINKERIILAIIFILFILQTLPTLIWSLKDQFHEYWTTYSNIYLDKRLFRAFDFINQEYEPKTVILASFYTGNYLPAFTHTVSFIGHFGYTYQLERKQESTDNFLSQKLTDREAKEFLKQNNIRLIFQGPEEKIMSPKPLYPDLLKPVFINDIVTVYQAKV